MIMNNMVEMLSRQLNITLQDSLLADYLSYHIRVCPDCPCYEVLLMAPDRSIISRQKITLTEVHNIKLHNELYKLVHTIGTKFRPVLVDNIENFYRSYISYLKLEIENHQFNNFLNKETDKKQIFFIINKDWQERSVPDNYKKEWCAIFGPELKAKYVKADQMNSYTFIKVDFTPTWIYDRGQYNGS